MSFANLKKNSRASLSNLNQKIKEMSEFKSDDRFWNLTVDKSGTGEATIRFMPVPEAAANDDEVPFVRLWDHGFKGPGGWYIENSLTSIGQDDPVSEWNSELWATENKANRDIVSGSQGKPGTKRRLHYVSNILVVDDPANPANNGKVFLFKYGKKIFEKLNSAMNPKFVTQKAVNPFDMWSGVNLVLRAHKEDDQRQYSQSEFTGTCPIAETDKDIEAIFKTTISLKEFVDPKNFKSYDELKAKLAKIMKVPTGGATQSVDQQAPVREAAKPKALESVASETQTAPWDGEEGDDDELAQFRKLAK